MGTSAVSSQDNALPGWCGCLVPVGFFLGLSCPDGSLMQLGRACRK